MRYILLIVLLAAALTARGASSPYIAELESLAAKPDYLHDLLERVSQPRDAEEFRAGLDWLREKSISGFGGSRITYSYAFNLFRAGVKDPATLAFLFGLLSSRVDAARCADPTAPTDKLRRWDQVLAPLLEHFHSLSIEEQRKLVSMAIDMEAKLSTRGPDVWMCSGGVSFTNKFFEKHKNNPNPPMREIQDPTQLGRTVLLNDPEIKPDFVPDAQWKSTREQLVTKFAQQLPMTK